ncbi:MAG: hypothetical protein ACUVUU_08450 [bacterium]
MISEKAIHPRQPEINTRGDIVIEIEGERKVLDPATGRLRTLFPYECYLAWLSPTKDRVVFDGVNRGKCISDLDG